MSDHGPLEDLIATLARLPGLGRRSAQRIALHLLARRDQVMRPLSRVLEEAAAKITPCSVCGHLDSCDPCHLCADKGRDQDTVCVVARSLDVWAMERMGGYRGLYHVTGGVLSVLDGVGPKDLHLMTLTARARNMEEVILALPATVDGYTTMHYITDMLRDTPVRVTRLAQGLPVGGELDHMDAGTIAAALRARREERVENRG